MEIKDIRQSKTEGFPFAQLEPGWVVQGLETGTIYYVARHHGGDPSMRLINLNKKTIQDKHQTTGRYRRILNAVLELRPE